MLRDRVNQARDRGMSLVEVVVAVVILGVFSGAVLGVILQTQAAGVNNRARIAAANLAARELDMVRDEFTRTATGPLDVAAAGTVTNPHPLTGQVAGEPLRVDGAAYTVVRESSWNLTGSGVSACAGGSLVVYPTLAVKVSVTWSKMGTIQPVVAKAALAPAKGKGIPGTASFVAVKVVDSAGQPNPGRAVTVAGGSETKTGTTDSSGCAVIQVNPAAGVGTAYTARVTDAGYVDISGTTGPVKTVGQLTQGQLNNSVSFAYDLAGSVRLQLVDPSGAAIDPATVAGSTVTLIASESSGGSSATTRSVTGVTTIVSGLWPTQYGAYFGTTPPAGGYASGALAPGGTLDIEVPLEMATGELLNVPPGTTSVIAVPAPATTCTASGARTVDPAGFAVLPGSWTFFATSPQADCAPGPSAVSLLAGSNDGTEWLPTTLTVTGAPASGKLWAVSRSKVPGATLTTCPAASYAPVALDVDAARTAPVVLPAGDWYVYLTDGAAGGACLSTPGATNYSKVLTYGAPNGITWGFPNAVVTLTGVSSGRVGVYSTSATTPGSYPAAGFTAMTSSGSTGSYRATLTPGTYYLYGCSASTSPRCRYGGKVVVGGLVAYNVAYSTSSPPVVGP